MRASPVRLQRGPSEHGAVIVEFAAIFVVFAMLLWGLITYGVIFAVQQSVTHAASDAARATVGLYPDRIEASQRVADVLATQFPADGWLDPSGLTHSVHDEPCATGDTGGADRQCSIVEVGFDWDGYGVVPELLKGATPGSLSARAVVQWD